MKECSYCGEKGGACDCYYDRCPICEKVLSNGRPCKDCKETLIEHETSIGQCKKCGDENLFVICTDCNENNAYFCINCYDNDKRNYGRLYTLCSQCN